jgi:hypothetical protein
MAILQLKNIKNNVNGSHKVTVPVSDHSTKGLNLYRTDTQTREEFKNTLGAPNPVYESLHTANNENAEYAYNFSPFINRYKVCELCFSSGLGDQHLLPSNENWGNWRNDYGVDPNVLLWVNEPKFNFSYTHQVKPAWEALKPGFLNQVEGALEVARLISPSKDDTGKFVSRYHEVPLWEGTTPVTIDGSLEFHFEFGQAGLFSGEHEVVRPIFALASKLTPYLKGQQVHGPAPTKPAYAIEMGLALAGKAEDIFKGLGEAGGDIIGSFLGGGGAAEAVGGIVSAATNVQKQIYAAIDEGVRSAASGTRGDPVRTVYFRIGRMSLGPFFCKSVAWNFDFTETDEYGFPYKGSITFSQLQSLWIAGSSAFIYSFDAD